MMAGRGSGKLLDVDTPIPTPKGWTTMGQLRIGDQVFDEAGKPCNVIWVSNTQFEATYRLTFSDGAELVAGASHQWVTWTHAERKAFLRSRHEPDKRRFPENWPAWRSSWQHRYHKAAGIHDGSLGPQIRTTAEIRATLFLDRARQDRNHCIPLAGALQLPEATLPVDPYVLGVWLGDGSSAIAELTTVDTEILEMVEIAGYPVGPPRRPTGKTPVRAIGIAPPMRDSRTGRMTANGSLSSILRAEGLLGRKHVPAAYLRASPAQRLSLLQGLMDTDGHCNHGSECEFVSTNADLANGVRELALSLGIKAVLHPRRAILNGRDCGPKYQVLFTTETPVFRLARKAERQRRGRGQQLRQHHRMIVAVDEVAPVPMRCIAVDSLHRMYLAGRAMIPTHNTRAGAEWIRKQKDTHGLIALVGNTRDDVRDVMIEGPAGLLAISPPGDYPTFEPGRNRLVWQNGAQAFIYSAQRPDQLRGPQHEVAWADELAAWLYPEDTWSNLQFGMRLGRHPRTVITTTPRPIKLVRELIKDPLTRVSRTSSYANRAHLAPSFFEKIIKRYEGTRLGRQEIYAELLEDVPGALWSQEVIEATRLPFGIKLPDFSRIVVAIDPSATSDEDSDETGIIVAAKDRNEHGYVLADVSGHYLPAEWAKVAINEFRHPERHADRIIAEVNNGGEMVENTLRMVDVGIPFKAVTATRGKVVRAEPVSALYEQRRVHHVGMFPALEDQMVSFTQDWDRARNGSPDRVDALVWAISELLVEDSGPSFLADWGRW